MFWPVLFTDRMALWIKTQALFGWGNKSILYLWCSDAIAISLIPSLSSSLRPPGSRQGHARDQVSPLQRVQKALQQHAGHLCSSRGERRSGCCSPPGFLNALALSAFRQSSQHLVTYAKSSRTFLPLILWHTSVPFFNLWDAFTASETGFGFGVFFNPTVFSCHLFMTLWLKASKFWAALLFCEK